MLASAQEQPAAADTVNRLMALYGRFTNDTQIALRYAKGLLVLSEKQTGAPLAETTERLRSLHRRQGENREIARVLAVCLVWQRESMDAQCCDAGIREVGELCAKYAFSEKELSDL